MRHWEISEQGREDRAAIARIHLAASELRRDVSTPRARKLVERILSATRELEARGSLADNRTPARAHTGGSGADFAAELERLHRRLAPIVASRGVAWRHLRAGSAACAEERSACGGSLFDADTLRRTTCELIRLGSDWAGFGGCIETQIEDGLRMSLRVESGTGDTASAFDATRTSEWSALAHWIALEGGELRIDAADGRVVAGLAAEETSCNAS